jgi:UDP-glucose 4-epimerase
LNLNGKRILITGGAGAIGTNLINRLKDNNGLWILDDLSSGRKENLRVNNNLTFVEGTVTDEGVLKKIFSEKIEIVFHLAAIFANQNSVDHPRLDLEVNGMGTLKLLEYARDYRIEKFVYTSSSCVYGDREGDLSEDCKEFSVSTPYAITKLLGERYTTFFHEYYGLPTVILRYFNSYGPWEFPGKYRNVIPNFFQWAKEGKGLPITGTGDETRDFNFVEDTIEGTILAAAHEKTLGRIYNIGSGRETRIKDLATLISKYFSHKVHVEVTGRRGWDRVSNRRANIARATDELGYRPRISLEEGLEKTYGWFVEHVW